MITRSRRPLHLGYPIGLYEFDVIRTYDNAYGFIEVAVELWRLAGREDRAIELEDVVLKAFRHELPRLSSEQAGALTARLEGLEQALEESLIGEQHLLSMEQVHELRGRTTVLDLDEARGEAAQQAVMKALVYVHHLRRIAEEAVRANAYILFD